MLLDYVTRGNTLLVNLGGDLDLSVADYFRDQIEEVLSLPGIENLVLEMSAVTFIDSSGLGVILGRYKKVMQKGGKIALINPNPQVKRILELSGILRIMGCFSSVDMALEELQGRNCSGCKK